ncbi:hypothetical protein CABS03_03039 [Colletotrichum abscissum]
MIPLQPGDDGGGGDRIPSSYLQVPSRAHRCTRVMCVSCICGLVHTRTRALLVHYCEWTALEERKTACVHHLLKPVQLKK